MCVCACVHQKKSNTNSTHQINIYLITSSTRSEKMCLSYLQIRIERGKKTMIATAGLPVAAWCCSWSLFPPSRRSPAAMMGWRCGKKQSMDWLKWKSTEETMGLSFHARIQNVEVVGQCSHQPVQWLVPLQEWQPHGRSRDHSWGALHPAKRWVFGFWCLAPDLT